MTVEDYWALDIDHTFTELVGGVVIVHDAMPLHAYAQARLVAELDRWARAVGGRGIVLCPTPVEPTDYDSYSPDVIWIAEQHIPADFRRQLPRVPDLVVEVRSPSTWHYDRGRKKDVYEAAGVPELWLVDTEAEAIIVHRRSQLESPAFDIEVRSAYEDTLRSPQLPGFELPLERIFRR